MDKVKKEAWFGGKEIGSEALTERKAINKKIFKFGCLPILILIVLIIIIDNTSTSEKSKDQSEAIVSISFIKGLTPLDVYLNLEKEGFKTSKKFTSEHGNFWKSTKRYSGIDYSVEVFSTDINKVESITISVMVDVTQKKIIATKEFLQFISTIPYEGSDPSMAAKWVAENFDNDKASIIIGGVKFAIYAPSIAARMLIVENENN